MPDLWTHQSEAIDFLYPLQRGGLFMDMRTGKSRTGLELFHRWNVQLGLIVCPKTVINVWTSEDSDNLGQIHKYFFDRWNVVPLIKGTVKDKMELAKEAVSRKRSTLLVVNYESAWREPLGPFLMNCSLQGVMTDESQKIKGISTTSSKYFGRLGQKVKHRLCLTGTPIPKDPFDIWAQYRFLAPEVFPKYFTQFKAQYSIIGNYQYFFPKLLKRVEDYFFKLIRYRNIKDLSEYLQQVRGLEAKLVTIHAVPDTVKKKLMISYLLKLDQIIENCKLLIPKTVHHQIITEVGKLLAHIEDNAPDEIDKMGFINLEQLNEKIYSVAFRVRARDVLDMPPEMDENILFDLNPKAQKLYNEFEKEMVLAYQEAGTISAPNVLTRNLRLQEFTAGWLKDDSGMYHRFGEEKDEALYDLLEGLGYSEPVVIFAKFHNSIDNIIKVCEKLNMNWVELSGRKDDSAKFERGFAQVIIAQVKSGGVGKNFSRARIVIFYETGYLSPGDYGQCRFRVLGSNQLAPSVTYFHLLARGTIDVAIKKGIGLKDNLMRYVVDEINAKYK